MYGYIYKTTNLINNKIYIGQHFAEHFEPEKYLGSGNLLRRAVSKYGKVNFKCELLMECNSQEELDYWERYWIEKEHSQDLSIGYNITPGGFGGCGPVSEETRKKLSEATLNTTLVNDGYICFRIPKSELAEYLNLGYEQGVLPYTRTEDFKQKVSASNSGKIAMSKDDIRTRVNPDQVEQYLADGYMIGWVKDEDRKVPELKTIEGTGKCKYMYKNTVYKLVPQSEWDRFLADGWQFGARKGRKKYIHKKGYKLSDEIRLKLSKSHKGKLKSPESKEKNKQASKDRVIINNGKVTTSVKIHDLDNYLQNGWVKGRLATPKNPRSKKIICVETGEIFNSITEALKQYPRAGAIRTCLKKGLAFTADKKHWMYANDIDSRKQI